MTEDVKTHMAKLADQSGKIGKLMINSKKCAKAKITKGYLETRLETANKYWMAYTSSYDFVTANLTTKELETYDINLEENYQTTEDAYLELKSWIKDHMYEYQKQEVQAPAPASITNTNQVSGFSQSKPRLPPIPIPTFSGDYNQWMSFRDLYVSLIHNDSTLSKIEKHHYLKASLSGEAELLLRNYSLTEANYDDAWKKLGDRYNNKRVIVNNILNRLLNQKKLTSESPKGIKDLLDTTSQCLDSLKNLKIDTSSWDAIVVHIVVSKLDIESHRLWEQSLEQSTDIPEFDELTSYLEKRFRAMEMINITQTKEPQRKDFTKPAHLSQKVTTVKSFATELDTACTYCSKNHYVCHCQDFASLTVNERQDFVKKNRICFNCLVKGHSVNQCRQSTTCKKCGRRHHTLLHFTNPNKTSSSDNPEPEQREQESTPSTSACNLSVNKAETMDGQVILATAEIAVESRNGDTYILRALVDQGSQGSFITEAASQLLNLERTPVNGKISGVSNSSVVTTKAMVKLIIHSTKDGDTQLEVDAYVLKKLTSLLPSREFPQDTWPSTMQLDLADPNFHKPGSIDVLLGADVHANIILEGLHKHESLIALNSRLGWLISGRVTQTEAAQEHNMVVTHTKVDADHLLRQFWEIEENLPHKKPLTDLEIQCEEHFKKTHSRVDGRYVLHLPFKDVPPINLGCSKSIAVSRLQQMEKRFIRNSQFKDEYIQFMKQYESANHMIKAPVNESDTINLPYYLPHHAVLRPTSLSTKLRVVFDGSAAPEKGNSLNDELLVGPPLQQDIRDLVTRWRQHQFCLVADIQKMYRQILIAKDDVDFQRILWRESPTQPIEEYQLLTVTYGTSCAPYLAIRTLHQLAEDEKDEYPVEAEILKTDVYMDDLMTGASTEEKAVSLQKGLTEVLARGGFPLHKWASNSESVLCQIPDDNKESQSAVNIKVKDTVKTLESGLNESVYDGELVQKGYSVVRCDRADGRKLGGVMLIAAPALTLHPLPLFNTPNLDDAQFELLIKDPKSFWAFVNNIRTKRRKDHITENGRSLSEAECANAFAEYFRSVYKSNPPRLDAAEAAAAAGVAGERVHVPRLNLRQVQEALQRLKPKSKELHQLFRLWEICQNIESNLVVPFSQVV
ncbi:uncharacterized protein LOC126375107 [Pectinophora gossypiella]|uniref:uncharacterized protein LOC126375107 n=1 Tax=Pectinophora gossypiella TaxID=13191 RepID=UPI00214EBEBC|nr:uncharacterized protein LOC126375107 [Pectinophora gossypiella]